VRPATVLAIALLAGSATSLGVTLVGAGVVGVGLGSVFGALAIGKKNDSNASGHCDPSNNCDATGTTLRNEALSDATLSTVAFGVGLAAAVGGVVLWLTAPSSTPAREARDTGARLRLDVSPTLGGAGLALRGVL
jgi:hypothetical protein